MYIRRRVHTPFGNNYSTRTHQQVCKLPTKDHSHTRMRADTQVYTHTLNLHHPSQTQLQMINIDRHTQLFCQFENLSDTYHLPQLSSLYDFRFYFSKACSTIPSHSCKSAEGGCCSADWRESIEQRGITQKENRDFSKSGQIQPRSRLVIVMTCQGSL